MWSSSHPLPKFTLAVLFVCGGPHSLVRRSRTMFFLRFKDSRSVTRAITMNTQVYDICVLGTPTLITREIMSSFCAIVERLIESTGSQLTKKPQSRHIVSRGSWNGSNGSTFLIQSNNCVQTCPPLAFWVQDISKVPHFLRFSGHRYKAKDNARHVHD